jgi:hypothetical protein
MDQVCEQLELQERHDDPQGGVRSLSRHGRTQKDHRGQRNYG